MTDNKKEQIDFKKQQAILNEENEANKLIGNKREREKEKEIKEDGKIIKKICNCCKLISSEQIIFSENIEKPDSFIELFSKEGEFSKLLKENFDKSITSKNIKINNICNKCILNEFIKGGISRIIPQKKSEDSEKKEKKDQDQIPNLWNKKVKEIMGIYSLNFNMVIIEIKKLKDEYIQTIKNVKEIFENSCRQMLFSKDKESFPERKKKIDNCAKNLKEIETHFDSLLKNLTTKEEMKKFILDSVLNNDANQRNAIYKLLKQLENEFESNILESKDNFSKNIIEQKKDKKNLSEMLMLNNNDLLKNNILLSPNNLFNNGHTLFNSGLGILPLGIPANPPNNLLLNNLMLNSSLNPSILNQINNTINLNSMLSNMNNNANDTNKNVNNINNIPLPGLNNLPNHNLNLNNPNNIDSLLYFGNLLNNNNNLRPTPGNVINNYYGNQLNPNLISPLSFNNLFIPNTQLVPPNLNSINNNSATLNNNYSVDEKNILNRKIPINIDKNIANINPITNNNNNLGNINNSKEINNIINNNLNNFNEMGNNNINKLIQNNQNIQNPNSNESKITELFNSVAANKDKNQNNKNTIYSNNLAQKNN